MIRTLLTRMVAALGDLCFAFASPLYCWGEVLTRWSRRPLSYFTPEPELGCTFVVSVKTGGWVGDRTIRVDLLPGSGELSFCWLPSGVGWTIEVNALLVMFEASGYCDPFGGDCSPNPRRRLPNVFLSPAAVERYLLDIGFDVADAPAERR